MQLLLLVLELIQAIVNPALRQKLLMRTLLAELSFMKHQNAISMLNRTQAMRNHQRRSSGQQPVQRLANQNSVFVSTLEVASSRIRNRGLCASARAKLISCRCPTESVEPRSFTGVFTLSGRELINSASPTS